MTSQELIVHIDKSINQAFQFDDRSRLTQEIFEITGFATPVMRHLINNICRLPKKNPVYLECGLWAGATFCAAVNNNPELIAYGIENFSQDFSHQEVNLELDKNIKQYCGQARTCAFAYQDCFTVDSEFVYHPADIFMYDAAHDYESQAKALPYFFERMNNPFVYWVDDYNWQTVWQGTADGFAALGDKAFIDKRWIFKGELPQDDPIWHNGVAIFACSKL